MKKCLAVLIWMVACGAAQAQAPSLRMRALQEYASEQKPLAESGQIKWSQYYSGLQDRYIDAHAPYEYTRITNQLYNSALEFEAGAITQDEFDRRRQNARAAFEEARQIEARGAQAQQQANNALAMRILQNQRPAPQLSFTLMAPIQAASPAQVVGATVTPFAAIAQFTGRQQQVQTVTNQSGWSCEYRYNSQNFWKTFTTSCPSSIQVQ